MTTVNGSAKIEEALIPCREEVNRALEKLRPFSMANTLENAIQDALFPGGKRLRPILALAAGEVFGKRTEAVVSVAASIELLHTASLILDDLPTMDNTDKRRGKPTLHRIHTPHLAILCAHSLVSHALHMPTVQDGLDAEACRRILRELSLCIGPKGMAAGQADDLAGVNGADGAALRVAACKTGHLFRAAGYCGAVAGGADEAAALQLREYGWRLGIAYQVADDFEDCRGEDKPGASVNVVRDMGEREAGIAFNHQLEVAENCARNVTQDGLLLDLVELVRGSCSGKI